jgi:hypothetical protein
MPCSAAPVFLVPPLVLPESCLASLSTVSKQRQINLFLGSHSIFLQYLLRSWRASGRGKRTLSLRTTTTTYASCPPRTICSMLQRVTPKRLSGHECSKHVVRATGTYCYAIHRSGLSCDLLVRGSDSNETKRNRRKEKKKRQHNICHCQEEPGARSAGLWTGIARLARMSSERSPVRWTDGDTIRGPSGEVNASPLSLAHVLATAMLCQSQ